MPGLSLFLVGPYNATYDGQPLPKFATVRAQALFIYLATEAALGSAAQRRESLMELLWPGMPARSGRKNLRQTLYYLRQVVPDRSGDDGAEFPFLIADRYTIEINPNYPLTLDVAGFLQLLDGPQEGWPEAVGLYRGDFLSDFYLDDSPDFEEWVLARREYLRRRALDALEALTIRAMDRRAYDEARDFAERQLALDSLRERAHRQLMEILARGGYREEALAQYEIARQALAAELGMTPSARTSDLFQRIQSGALGDGALLAQDVRGYALKERIGEGAFGDVHRAIQAAVNREVAVKVIRQKYADEPAFIRRFEAEAQTVARLEHPHIVPLYDFWRDPEGAYLVMRFMKGGDLRANLKKGPWGVEPSLKLLLQIAAALSAAHRQGIVHRDIKPANILFDQEGNAYLSDFGIAKSLDDLEPAVAQSVAGTSDYITPEQIKDEPVSPRTDIYSLGIILYEMLTGARPFGDGSLAHLLYKQLHEPVPPMLASRPELPPQIDKVIQQATAKRPADRYADALELAEAFRLATRGELVRPVVISKPERPEVVNPYKGLRAFQEADAEDFFGRDALVRQLAERLAESRFLAVVGPSGSGKSSVVKAGLIPALRAGTIPGSEKWFVAEMVPGTYPLEELEKALWPIAVDPPASMVEPMRRDAEGLLRTIRRILPDEPGAELLLVIDQFEELFTLVEDERRRTHFIDSLLAAVGGAHSPLRVVITLRADFYDRPLQIQPLGKWLKENSEVVLPMSPAELAGAIQEPARRVGVELEEGLLATVVAEVSHQPGTLPLMQYALTELFDRRQAGLMTHAAYEEIGGVMGAVGRRAEALYASLDEDAQEAARQLFLRLVAFGEDAEDTRRRALRAELLAIGGGNGQQGNRQFESVIDQFGRARLLTFDRDPVSREPTVEVAHEALLREWPRLRGWLDESRDDIRLQRMLASAEAEWAAAGHDEGYLLAGARLSQYESWVAEAGLALTREELAFLEASLSAQQRREAEEDARRRRELETAQRLAEAERARAEEQSLTAQRLRRRALYLGAALVIAAILALVAVAAAGQANRNARVASEETMARATQQAIAEQNAARAEEEAAARATEQARAERSAAESRSLALSSGAQVALRDGNTDQALALAVAANQMEDPPAFSQRLLYDAALAPGTVRQIVGGGGWRWSLDVDPSGRVAASGADDASITLWDIDSGAELIRLEGGHTDGIGGVAFTPDGKRLLSGSFDDRLVLWDVTTGAAIRTFENPSGDVNSVDVSPDGSLAIAGTEGGLVTLWDLQSGELIAELAGHDPTLQVLPVAFSPDGRLAASGSEDGTVILWDVAEQAIQHRLEGHQGIVMALGFSPDGQYLASGAFDNAIIIWSVETGQPVTRLEGHTDFVFDVAFSADGSRLLSASRDQTLILWDVASARPIHTYAGEGGRALSVELLEGDRALSGHSTGNLRLWALADARLARHLPPAGQPVVSAALSPDQRSGALGLDGQIWLLDMAAGRISRRLRLEGGEVTSLAFHPIENTLLAGSDDGSMSLWDMSSGEEVRRYEGHALPGVDLPSGYSLRVQDLAFSPDGRYFLSASGDQTMRQWDTETGAEVQLHENPTDTANAVAYDPQGRYLAAGFGNFRFGSQGGDLDYSIYLMDAATGEEVHKLSGHEGPVVSLAFSPDGSQLLTGSIDNTLRLWDVATGEEVRRFDGHSGGVFAIAFSPDGQYVASGSQDASVIVWRTATGELLRRWTGQGESVIDVVFRGDGRQLWTTLADGSLNAWSPVLELDELLDWTAANRYVRELTCSERGLYGLDGVCG